MRTAAEKQMTLAAALLWRRQLADEGRELVVTNGCFDLLHRGHVEYLNGARDAGDALLVFVNSDASVQAVKGPGRPVVPGSDRAYMLASLECTDAVVVFDTPDCVELFRQVVPDIYAKGGDYTAETLVRQEYLLLKSLGCRFVFVPFVEGLSTTDLIRRIKTDDPPGP